MKELREVLGENLFGSVSARGLCLCISDVLYIPTALTSTIGWRVKGRGE